MTTSIRLEPEIEQRLNRLVNQTGRTKAFYLREIISSRLENMKSTISLLTYWNESIKVKNRLIPFLVVKIGNRREMYRNKQVKL